MKKLIFVFIGISIALLSCKSRSNNDSTAKNSVEIPMTPAFWAWENPALDSTPFLKSAEKPDLDKTAEGLTLVDSNDNPYNKIDSTKGVVIYIHGWTPTGDIPKKVFPKAWFEKFNVFYFRWHRRSFDHGILNSGMVPERSWLEMSDATKQAKAQFEKLYTLVGRQSFTNEMRIVGYSLGSFLAVDLAHDSSFAYNSFFQNGGVRRLDLIEPFLFKKSIDRTFAGGCQMFEKINFDRYSEKLETLGQVAATTAYTSSIGGLFSSSIWRMVSNVQMNSKWLEARDLETQHTEMVPAYFESFAETTFPKTENGNNALTAATPAKEIKGNRRRLIQTGGIKTRTFSDDVFKVVNEGPCPGGTMIDTYQSSNDYQLCGARNVDSTVLNLVRACF